LFHSVGKPSRRELFLRTDRQTYTSTRTRAHLTPSSPSPLSPYIDKPTEIMVEGALCDSDKWSCVWCDLVWCGGREKTGKGAGRPEKGWAGFVDLHAGKHDNRQRERQTDRERGQAAGQSVNVHTFTRDKERRKAKLSEWTSCRPCCRHRPHRLKICRHQSTGAFQPHAGVGHGDSTTHITSRHVTSVHRKWSIDQSIHQSALGIAPTSASHAHTHIHTACRRVIRDGTCEKIARRRAELHEQR